MKGKVNRRKIKKQLKDALTVKDVREYISELADDTVVGIKGHFGEVHLCGKKDIGVKSGYITPDGNWRNENQETIAFLSINMWELGPDPD